MTGAYIRVTIAGVTMQSDVLNMHTLTELLDKVSEIRKNLRKVANEVDIDWGYASL